METNKELIAQLREYASNSGYSHNDYADTMRDAADALEKQADAAPVGPTEAEYAAVFANDVLDEVMKERDHYHDIADGLAEAIAEYFDADIGEHSSANCPWDEALRVIEEAPPLEQRVVSEKPYAYEYGKDNGDGTYSVVIDRGDMVQIGPREFGYAAPANAIKDRPVTPLYTTPPAAPVALSDAKPRESQTLATLRKSLAGWQDEAEAMRNQRDTLRQRLDLQALHQKNYVWYWQGDGTDYPESFGNSMAIVIRGDQLRAILAAATQPTNK